MKKPTLSDSLSATNAYKVICSEANTTQKYAICLMQISLGREKNYEQTWEPCRKPLQCGSCPALAMRKEEISSGEVIYYQADNYDQYVKDKEERDRVNLASRESIVNKIDKNGYSYLRGRYGAEEAGRMMGREVARDTYKPAIKRKPVITEPIVSLEAQLVNKLAKKPPNPTTTQAGPIRPMPGEKPMDFRARLLESRRVKTPLETPNHKGSNAA